MNQNNVLNLLKKITAGMIAIGILTTGMLSSNNNVEAAPVSDKIVYEKVDHIEKYWTKKNKTAPIKEGYVFGGWYSAEDEDAYFTEDTLEGVTSAYAKFVPAQVLSVKAQNELGTKRDTSSTYVRVISSLDSNNYQKVGFDIWLANKKQLLKKDGTALETNRIYEGILVGEDERTANSIFGGVSKYVSVWQLNNVIKDNYNKIIYVRPYWITMDGTKVDGLAKYVHIEDEYLNYISVPVNLLGGEEVAAGTLNMTYNTTLTFVEFEGGRLLPEMKFQHDEANKTIRMVGNAITVDENIEADGIFANVRFKKPTEDAIFEISPIKFCGWNEKLVSIKSAWDVKYDVKETTQQ